MLFNVPQHIDVEDKIVGPLTWKQLGWMALMIGIVLAIWMSVENKGIAILAIIPVVLLFVALAFYKPYGQTLTMFIFYSVFYIVKPKVYIWKRAEEKPRRMSAETKNEKTAAVKVKKKLELEDIESIAKTLDSEGQERNDRIMEIIKERQKSK